MNKIFGIALACAIFLSACTSSKKSENSDSSNHANDHQVSIQALPDHFYKRLEGTIAGKPVVMNLQALNGDIDGNYYYDGAWLNLSIDALIGKDSLVLAEYSYNASYFYPSAKEPKLALKWTGNGFKGTWKNGEGTKSAAILLSEKYPEGSYPFTTGSYQDSVKAYKDKSSSPTAQISFEYLKATSTDEAGKWLDQELKKISGLAAKDKREEGFKVIAADYFKDYQSQFAEQKKESKDDAFEGWMNYTDNSQQSILFNQNGFVVIDFLADAYTGGAHGNYNSSMYCLDVKNKKQMVLGDVVKIDSNSLQKLLERNLRQQYNIKPQDQISTVLFDNFLKPNKNFYFNSKGLAFMYNPYEVASYAQGQIVVFIPFTELKSYLTPAFIERMKIN